MYRLVVEGTFSAAHAIVVHGVREPIHGHDWRVRVGVTGQELDGDDLLVDFHALQRALEGVIGPWRTTNLNDAPQFQTVNPTAEAVARTIGRAMAAWAAGSRHAGAPRVRVEFVEVTEAPGCAATYLPEP